MSIAFVCAAGTMVNTEIFIATDGNDANTGTIDSPFLTLPRAQEAVRNMKKDSNRDIVVYLREGIYYLNEALELNELDGGESGQRIIYRSYSTEQAVISGGAVTGAFVSTGNNIYAAPLPGAMTRQLFVNGSAAKKAQGTEKGNGNAVEEIREVSGGWQRSYFPLLSDGTMVSQAAENFKLLDSLVTHKLAFYRNSPSHIKSPGEFAVTRDSVYYYPRTGENIAEAKATMPALDRLITIKGSSPDRKVQNIIFQEIAFAHTTWSGFDSTGFADFHQGHMLFKTGNAISSVERVPAAICVSMADNIRFEKCRFDCMGGSGIDFADACRLGAVTGCTFTDIGAIAIAAGPVGHPGTSGSIYLGWESFKTDDERLKCLDIEISHNSITRSGMEFSGCPGIFAGFTEGIRIHHNELYNLPAVGISVGWGWSIDTSAILRNNAITGNYVHDCMQELVGDGLISLQGSQPQSRADSNLLVLTDAANGVFFNFAEACGNFDIKHNMTFGNTFSFQTSLDAHHLTFDSCYVDNANYWASSMNDPSVTVDHIFVKQTPPQSLYDNAGIHLSDVQLTSAAINRPNRHSDFLQNFAGTNGTVKVYNLQGRLIRSKTTATHPASAEYLKANRLPSAGIYVVCGEKGARQIPNKVVSINRQK
jgi:hypothetical protein